MGGHRASGGCRSISEVQLGSSYVAVLGRCAWRDEGEDVHDKELANQRICNGTAGKLRTVMVSVLSVPLDNEAPCNLFVYVE